MLYNIIDLLIITSVLGGIFAACGALSETKAVSKIIDKFLEYVEE